jgi:pimeloyl-ACP methyl ester carboxylesterase
MNILEWTSAGLAVLVALGLAYAALSRRSVSARALAGQDGRFVEVHGRQLHYTRNGQGRHLVLIHGFAGSTYTWRGLIPLLADDYTVYAVDLLGFGLSDKPLDGRYSLADQGDLIVGLIAALKLDRPALAGHSMGGIVAALAAVQSPERIGALVLLDPGFYHGGPPALVKYLFFPFDLAAALAFYSRSTRTKSLMRAYYDRSLVTDELVDNYLKPARTPGARTVLSKMNKYAGARYDDICARIRTPTLLVWGRNDTIVPWSDAERILGEINGARLATIDNAGHMVQEERPQEVAAAIREFLR